MFEQLQELNDNLMYEVNKLKTTGKDYALAYTNYRVKLSQELLKLKADGMPVTIAYDIARGTKEVANAKFQEIAKEAIYKSNLEVINAIKLNIKVLMNQYDKEYSVSGEGQI